MSLIIWLRGARGLKGGLQLKSCFANGGGGGCLVAGSIAPTALCAKARKWDIKSHDSAEE